MLAAMVCLAIGVRPDAERMQQGLKEDSELRADVAKLYCGRPVARDAAVSDQQTANEGASCAPGIPEATRHALKGHPRVSFNRFARTEAVSYTHLTLPTIPLV